MHTTYESYTIDVCCATSRQTRCSETKYHTIPTDLANNHFLLTLCPEPEALSYRLELA